MFFFLEESKKITEAVTLKHSKSGRVLKISTNQPGVQVYTGNYLDGLKGKDGAGYKQHSSVALEAQFWPDAPNQVRKCYHLSTACVEPRICVLIHGLTVH